jgi:hypothetical protein
MQGYSPYYKGLELCFFDPTIIWKYLKEYLLTL